MFKCHRNVQDKVKSLEALCAHASSMYVSKLNLGGRELRLQNDIATHTKTKFMVWRATTTGCQIYNGTIRIPTGCTLLLDGMGAHFQGITFTGMLPFSHELLERLFRNASLTVTAF